MFLMLADEAPWYVQFVKDAGPVAVALAVFVVLLIALWKIVGENLMGYIERITDNCRTAAESSRTAATTNKDAAETNEVAARTSVQHAVIQQETLAQGKAIIEMLRRMIEDHHAKNGG